MTFTYTPSATPDEVTKVRFWIGDTEADAALFTDEEIGMAVSVDGTAQKATLGLIRVALAKLAHEPDLTADWLKIEWRRSAESWQALLKQREREFGLGARATSGAQHAYRADSYQRGEPDWAAAFAEPDWWVSGTRS